MTFCMLSAFFAAQLKTSINKFHVSVIFLISASLLKSVSATKTLLCYILECKVKVHGLSLLIVPWSSSSSLHLTVLVFSAV